jgi:hypothetical protein
MTKAIIQWCIQDVPVKLSIDIKSDLVLVLDSSAREDLFEMFKCALKGLGYTEGTVNLYEVKDD